MAVITAAVVDVGANGQWKASQGTITADKQAWLSTATWNAAVTFTHLKANITDTSSNAASLLMDLQVGGLTKFSVRKDGGITGTLLTAAQPNVTSLGSLTGLTVAGTLVLTGGAVTGAPTWNSSQAITLSTAAQPNITSVGTLTALTVSGAITASGGQIVFPAAQNASANANTLDDYEEGTFTSSILFGGAATGNTYGNTLGQYTKVGNLVSFRIYVSLTAKGSATGAVTVGGLPFTSAATYYSQCACWSNGLTGVTGIAAAYINPGTTAITITILNNGNETGALADTGVTNNGAFLIAGHYTV